MKPVWKTVRKEWDRAGAYFCFTTFGVVSLITPPASQLTTPRIITIVFNSELIIAGVLMFIGLFAASSVWRRTGYAVYLFGLLGIAFFISMAGSPVAILIIGLTFQGFLSLRSAARDEEVATQLQQVANQLSEEKDGGT